MDPDPNSNMCKAYAHFDGPGWTKFKLVGLIIELSEKIDKLEDQNNDDFYKQWNAKEESDEEIEEEARLKDGDDELSWSK